MNCKRRLLPIGLVMAFLCLAASVASAAELELAGVRLGRTALSIIQKLGNPTEVRVGQAGQVQGGQGPVGMPGQPAAGIPGMFEGPMPSGIPGMEGPMPSTVPGAFPMGMPGPAGPFAQEAPKKQGPPEVTWIYRFPKNRTLEFIINPDGRIVQIAAYGVEWSNVRTARGITLGDTYKDVVVRYGYPEAHQQRGIELLARYPEKHRAVFTIVGKIVVGITIALMD